MAGPSGSTQPSLDIGEGFLPEGVGIVAVGVKKNLCERPADNF